VPADAAAGFALSAEAGWGQTKPDWHFMITDGEAWGQIAPDGRLIATSLVLPYGGRVGWIAMVLTTGSHRRLGIASANLRLAIERCEAHGLIAGLDATPVGRTVYAPLGFKDALGLHRLAATRPGAPGPARSDVAIRLLRTVADLDRVTQLDAAVFGAKRRALLTYLCESEPTRALLAHSRGRLAGFVLARASRAGLHVGPLVADDDAIAEALLRQATAGSAGPVSIDVPDDRQSFLAVLGDAGFAPVRPFARMFRNAPGPIGDPGRCYAIAGPEFG
jgi:hypothetical protein